MSFYRVSYILMLPSKNPHTNKFGFYLENFAEVTGESVIKNSSGY